MSLENIRSLIRRKNLDRIFSGFLDYLEGLGDGGGSSPQRITLPVGFNATLPEVTSEVVEIVIDGSEAGEVSIWLPAGRTPYDRMILHYVDDLTGNSDLFIDILGWGVNDPTLTYVYGKFKISLTGWIELKWNEYLGWVLVDYMNARLPSKAIGKTVYDIEFNDVMTSANVPFGSVDAIVNVSDDVSQARNFTVIAYTGGVSGQRVLFKIEHNPPSTVVITGSMANFISNGNDITSISFTQQGFMLVEWSVNLDSWIIIEVSSSATLIP